MLQTFRHGFPHQPTAVAFDPVQKLLAIGTKSGSLRMYPYITKIIWLAHINLSLSLSLSLSFFLSFSFSPSHHFDIFLYEMYFLDLRFKKNLSLGTPGVDVHIKHEGGAAVIQLQFLVNEGGLLSATADDTLHLWNFRQKIPQVVQSLKFQRERFVYKFFHCIDKKKNNK